MRELTNHEYIYAVYGDLGVVNARSLGKIQQEAQRSLIDAVLHIGQSVLELDKSIKTCCHFTFFRNFFDAYERIWQ